MRDERFVYLDVSASELEEQQMANPPPVSDIGRGQLSPSQAQLMHAIALAHGLPDIHGFYGYDFEERSFIKLPQSKEKRVAVPQLADLGAALRDAANPDGDEELEELTDAELDAALREGFEE